MMNMISKTVVLVGLSTALSGCLLTRNQDFNEAAREAATIAGNVSGLPELEAADLPDTGSATYQGIAALNYDERLDVGDENNDYFADISFDADFETGGVEGSMTNFQSPEGEVGGSLTLVDGEIFNNGVSGDFMGTLDDDGTDVTIDIGIQSDFLGDGTGEPSALTGVFTGQFTTDEGDEGDMLGSFVTEFVRP